MEVYIKIGSHQFYRIQNGKCQSINTERKYLKNTVSLPTGYVKDVTVITKEEFDKAKESIEV